MTAQTGNPDYWERVRQTLNEFYKPGDHIYCIRVFRRPNSICQLCSHEPITWNHVLQNARTKKILIVGNRCVWQYKEAIKDKGHDGTVNYLPNLSGAAEFINSRFPGTARIASQENIPETEYHIEDYHQAGVSDQGFIEEDVGYGIHGFAPEGLGGDEIDWDSHDYD